MYSKTTYNDLYPILPITPLQIIRAVTCAASTFVHTATDSGLMKLSNNAGSQVAVYYYSTQSLPIPRPIWLPDTLH